MYKLYNDESSRYLFFFSSFQNDKLLREVFNLNKIEFVKLAGSSTVPYGRRGKITCCLVKFALTTILMLKTCSSQTNKWTMPKKKITTLYVNLYVNHFNLRIEINVDLRNLLAFPVYVN